MTTRVPPAPVVITADQAEALTASACLMVAVANRIATSNPERAARIRAQAALIVEVVDSFVLAAHERAVS